MCHCCSVTAGGIPHHAACVALSDFVPHWCCCVQVPGSVAHLLKAQGLIQSLSVGMGDEVRLGRGWMFWGATLTLTQEGEEQLEHVLATLMRGVQVRGQILVPTEVLIAGCAWQTMPDWHSVLKVKVAGDWFHGWSCLSSGCASVTRQKKYLRWRLGGRRIPLLQKDHQNIARQQPCLAHALVCVFASSCHRCFRVAVMQSCISTGRSVPHWQASSLTGGTRQSPS